MQTRTVLIVFVALVTAAIPVETAAQPDVSPQVFEYHEVDVLPTPRGEKDVLAAVMQNAQWDPMCHAFGFVYLRFVVSEEGVLQEPWVIRGLAEPCDDMAKKALLASSPWIPGQRNGALVATVMYVRIPLIMR